MMNKLLISLILIAVIRAEGMSQEYDTCQYIHRFAGEWRYTNGTDTIRIYLRAQRNYYADGNSVQDRLFGWHEYKRGDTIIESIYQNRFMPIPNVDTITKNSFSIWLKMGTDSDCNSNAKASGPLTDYSQGKTTKIVTTTVDSTGTIMTWKQRHQEGYGMFGTSALMTLPPEFVLVKQ